MFTTLGDVSGKLQPKTKTQRATRRVMVKEVELPTIHFEPIYRVLLLPTEQYRDYEVIRKICTHVPPVSISEATRAVNNANTIGVGIVITCHIDDATLYMSKLRHADLPVRMEEA